MSIIIRQEQYTHWYTRDGQARHEIAKKDGSGMRATTVKDARENDWVPSVSNIFSGGMPTPSNLIAWREENILLASLTLPRFDNEEAHAYAQRVMQDATAYTKSACYLGTQLHDAADLYLTSRAIPTDPALLAMFQPFKAWADENVIRVIKTETCYVHKQLGYGGRIDLLAEIRGHGICLLDLKTQRQKQDKKGQWKVNAYETWPIQLEAYRRAIGDAGEFQQPARIGNIVLNTAAPSPVHLELWPETDADAYWSVFQNAFGIWKYLKNYNPSRP